MLERLRGSWSSQDSREGSATRFRVLRAASENDSLEVGTRRACSVDQWPEHCVRDHQGGTGVVPLMDSFARRVDGAGGGHDAAGAEHGEVRDKELGAIGEEKSDAVAFAEAERLETCGAAMDVIEERGIRDAMTEEDHRRFSSSGDRDLFEHLAQCYRAMLHALLSEHIVILTGK